AEDGIRDFHVTGVQTCALPIYTTLLSLEVGPASHQTCTHVLELGQLDLQLALMGARPLGKDVQNQTGAVQHSTGQRSLEVALLRSEERRVGKEGRARARQRLEE